MKVTLSVIKTDIGSIGGHMAPSRHLLDIVRCEMAQLASDLDFVIDHCVSFTGDGIAILMTHTRGIGDRAVHGLAWAAIRTGTREAKTEGLYGADQVKDAFSGDVKDMGPAVAEMEIEERDNEPLLMFAADKTDPGAFNLPLYLAFADPMNTPGLILSPKLARGFRFVIMDANHAQGDRVIELDAPEQLYEIAALLRDAERYVVESVSSRSTGEQAVAVATSRPPRNIAGKYIGNDDAVMIVRTQMNFPAAGEILAPYATAHFVAGGLRGSHNMPLMPVALNTGNSYFDGPPQVSCAAFAIHRGKLTEPLDCFAHPFWDSVRARAAEKGMEIRKQGFFGAAMLPTDELQYDGIAETLERLQPHFRRRKRAA